jgi:triacylglycerol lipase
MLSILKPTEFSVQSLTTIATPHRSTPDIYPPTNFRGSAFADYVLSYFINPHPASATPSPTPPSIFRFLQSLGIQTAAFEELTTTNMAKFNALCPDREDIRYFSFGASFKPTWGSVFRSSHNIIEVQEGENDGLVSVKSAVWGEYKGTIPDVNHLDIINWVFPPEKSETSYVGRYPWRHKISLPFSGFWD